MHSLQILFSFLEVFYSVDSLFCCTGALNLIRSHLSTFAFVEIAFGVLCHEIFAHSFVQDGIA